MNRTSPYYCRRSVLSLLISALIYALPGMAAFTPDVIGVVNDETVDGSQRVDERGTTNNTHIINHGQQNVYGGVLMNPLMILVKIIKLRWIHILSYDQMV
ncbi:hypothetical protein OU616_28640, partial [Escherichia coli]|nr:hypothetical protein [Escherichia coli]